MEYIIKIISIINTCISCINIFNYCKKIRKHNYNEDVIYDTFLNSSTSSLLHT